MTIHEDVVYNVRLTGTSQVIAESKRTAAAVDTMKRRAASSTSTVPLAGGPRGVAGLAATQGRITALQGETARELDRLALRRQALDRELNAAAATTAARPRRALGLRGRAVAQAAGAGRFAGLAMPFGGWGALLGIGAGITAVSQVKAALTHEGEVQRLNAQTAAGIKSTGGSAHVTARQVRELASSIANLAGAQDETVHGAENILLTFPSIRNGIGKQNKVFNEATLQVANISARMGTDMPQAALQLGKALNDPIKGVGALRRIGIQFTDAQVEQIKVMIASGNRMGAQKIILHEVNREFGHSAEAAGKTLPGALTKLGEKWEDQRARLVKGLLPAATRFTNWLTLTLPGAIDTALTAMSLFATDPRANALSRWLHRNWAGSFTGGAFDYLLTHSGKDVFNTLDRKTGGALGTSGIDLFTGGSSARVVGGQVAGRFGAVPGSGAHTRPAVFEPSPVKVMWQPGNPLEQVPVILVADGQQIAKVVTKQQQKRSHAEGRGTAHRG